MEETKYISIKYLLRTIADVIIWTILICLIIVGGLMFYYFITTKVYETKGEEYAPRFALYTIISPSMEPNIKVYDVILDERIDDISKIKKGDIITFISSSKISQNLTVTHRVIEIIDNDGKLFFRTKGDYNLSEDDALVSQDNVLGKVVVKLPQLGRIQFFLASKGGWIIAVLIPALGIIIYDLIKLFKLLAIKNKISSIENK